jgi:hypothetical protein
MRRIARPRPTAGPTSTVPGAILPDAVYRLDELAARAGWGGHALRAARRRGLKIHRHGKRGYVLGRDFIDLVTKGGAGHAAE